MIEKKIIESYKDYGRVVCLSNGVIEAYVTVDLGPRIIRFGYAGSQNFMRDDRSAFEIKQDKEYTDFFGEGKKWENLGGHRVWISPESYPDTYLPSDNPVEYEFTDVGAIFRGSPCISAGIQLTLEIKLDDDDANMQVLMRVKNISSAEKRFAIWGLTVSAQGGTLVIPMNTNDTGLLPNRIIAVWPYTDMSDNRIYWGKKYITVRQDNFVQPIKLGCDLNCGSTYYCLNGEIFRKHYDTGHPNAEYPDGGCSFETYTNNEFIEIESLGILNTVKPGETVENTESWSLYKQPCNADFKNDNEIDCMLSKL